MSAHPIAILAKADEGRTQQSLQGQALLTRVKLDRRGGLQGNQATRPGSRWSCGWLTWQQDRPAVSPSWASAASLTSESLRS